MTLFQSLLKQQNKLESPPRKYLYLSIAILSLATIHVAPVQAQDFDGDNDIRIDTDNVFGGYGKHVH